jgi:very-short-patch-repair endonuclease
VHWDDRSTSDAFGLPSVPRILREILRCRGLEEFFVTLESSMRQRKIGAAGLHWLRGNTNAEARKAIGLARWDADSGLESLVRWRLRTRGLSVRTQVSVPTVGIVDLVIGERLIVEVDGKENHDDESHRHKDLLRDANAAALGYVTLRFDYALVVHAWTLVERAILGQLAAGRHL